MSEKCRSCWVVDFGAEERDGFFLVGRKAGFRWQDLEKKEASEPNPVEPLVFLYIFSSGSEDLRQVLVDHLFQPLALMKYACHLQQVDYSAIQVLDLGGPEAMEEAFRKGRGDFVHLQGPAAQQLEHEGTGVVVASMGSVIGPVAFSSLFARREWLKSDMARAFMRAYSKGRRASKELEAKEVAEAKVSRF